MTRLPFVWPNRRRLSEGKDNSGAAAEVAAAPLSVILSASEGSFPGICSGEKRCFAPLGLSMTYLRSFGALQSERAVFSDGQKRIRHKPYPRFSVSENDHNKKFHRIPSSAEDGTK